MGEPSNNVDSSHQFRLSNRFLTALSNDSLRLIEKLKQIPLKEKKILHLVLGEIISDDDKNMVCDPDDSPDYHLLVDHAENEADEKLDLELFAKLGEIVNLALDHAPIVDQLIKINEANKRSVSTFSRHVPLPSTPAKTTIVKPPAATPITEKQELSASTPGSSLSSSYFSDNFSNCQTSTSINCTERPQWNYTTISSNSNHDFDDSNYFDGDSMPASNNMVTSSSSVIMPGVKYGNYVPRFNCNSFGSSSGQGTSSTVGVNDKSYSQQPIMIQNKSTNSVVAQQSQQFPILQNTPYKLPSLELFSSKVSKNPPKRRKSVGFANLPPGRVNSFGKKGGFKTPPPAQEDPNQLEEFNDMFDSENQSDMESKPNESNE